MSVNSFADELRARSDEAIAQLFEVRPDLLSPVPTDLSALSARANSTPSLMRALETLNKFQLEVLTTASTLNQPFSKSELLSVSVPEAGEELLRLWAAALVYKDGSKFRLPGNLGQLIGDEPAGLGPRSLKKIDFKALKDLPADSAAVLERLT